MSPSEWPNVKVVDREFMTDSVHRASDGPLRTACAVLFDTSDNVFSLHSKEGCAVEQGFPPREDDAAVQGFPRVNNVVEQVSSHMNVVVGPGLSTAPIVVD